jgi:ABC-2 type transport system permease protein
MINNFKLYQRMIGVRIRAQMQYRISFVFDALTTAIVSGVSFLTIALVLQRFDGIAGWGLAEVAFLFGMVETSFGIMDMLFSGFDPPYFGGHVRLGTIDQMLLRPVNITLQVLGSDFITRRMGRILQGILVLGYAISSLDISWTWFRMVYLPIVILSQVLFFGGLFIIGSTLTFWTIESIEAINIFTYGGTEMMSYPMHIFPSWMVRFFTFIIPAIFLNYYPAIFFLEKVDPLNLPPFAPYLAHFVGVGVMIISLLFWNHGIRHYQSTGS